MNGVRLRPLLAALLLLAATARAGDAVARLDGVELAREEFERVARRLGARHPEPAERHAAALAECVRRHALRALAVTCGVLAQNSSAAVRDAYAADAARRQSGMEPFGPRELSWEQFEDHWHHLLAVQLRRGLAACAVPPADWPRFHREQPQVFTRRGAQAPEPLENFTPAELRVLWERWHFETELAAAIARVQVEVLPAGLTPVPR